MIKILIADDHPIVRQGFKQVLSETADLVVANEAGNGQEVLALVARKEYDVILLDISMPGKNGLEVLKELRITNTKIPVMSQKDHRALLESQIYPELMMLKSDTKAAGLLVPQVVYGHFPCQSDGNDLVVYTPESVGAEGTLKGGSGRIAARFSFPRQTHSPYLCISDFFAHVGSGKCDVVSFHLVTMGRKASEHSKKLFEANDYKDYLYFHGLSVECAEALAELWHQKIRQELGIAGKDSADIRKLFAQGYQGSRYSFGYPACPNLEDQTKLFELLRPERIGVNLTEEFQLEPEQSTSSIIVHHPQARYFNVR